MTDEPSHSPTPSDAQRMFVGCKRFDTLYDAASMQARADHGLRETTFTFPDGSKLQAVMLLFLPGNEKLPQQRTYEAQRQAWTDAVGTVNNDTPSE